jgi:hypothetical protein
LDGPASALFRIKPHTGEIFALQKFDRELNDSFILDVQATDSSDSDLPSALGPNRGEYICANTITVLFQ